MIDEKLDDATSYVMVELGYEWVELDSGGYWATGKTSKTISNDCAALLLAQAIKDVKGCLC